jgi:hypothetical protein
MIGGGCLQHADPTNLSAKINKESSNNISL